MARRRGAFLPRLALRFRYAVVLRKDVREHADDFEQRRAVCRIDPNSDEVEHLGEARVRHVRHVLRAGIRLAAFRARARSPGMGRARKEASGG